jgi:hypothetical protein
MSEDREDVAEEVRRVREEVRRRARLESAPPAAESPALEVRTPQPVPRETVPPSEPPPSPPDAAAVNEAWRAETPLPGGHFSVFRRLLERVLGPRFEAQQAFNARQVQLDNEMLRYVEERFAATHRHYDRILGLYGRHLGESDERHLILQEELVAHVQDLVRRVDLVLEESDRGRLSLEAALEQVRASLRRLEERLPPR